MVLRDLFDFLKDFIIRYPSEMGGFMCCKKIMDVLCSFVDFPKGVMHFLKEFIDLLKAFLDFIEDKWLTGWLSCRQAGCLAGCLAGSREEKGGAGKAKNKNDNGIVCLV